MGEGTDVVEEIEVVEGVELEEEEVLPATGDTVRVTGTIVVEEGVEAAAVVVTAPSVS